MKEQKLFGIHRIPEKALQKDKELRKQEDFNKFTKALDDAKKEMSVNKKISTLSKAYQSAKTIEEKILVYKEGKGELGKDVFFTNIKNDILKTNSIENLNKMFWKGGRSLSNEAAQKLEKLGHKDTCKCEICSKYHKLEISAIKSAMKKSVKEKKASTKVKSGIAA